MWIFETLWVFGDEETNTKLELQELEARKLDTYDKELKTWVTKEIEEKKNQIKDLSTDSQNHFH